MTDNGQHPPFPLPYVLCEACAEGRCDDCEGKGRRRDDPLCGHRCPWTETEDE